MADSNEEAMRRAHHWKRRSKAALEGRHLPEIKELLRGMPFLSNNVASDAAAWSERLAPRISKRFTELEEARRAIEALSVSPRATDFLIAIRAIEAAADPNHDVSLYGEATKLVAQLPRLRLYAASSGDIDCAHTTAQEALSYVSSDVADVEGLIASALGWLRAGQRRIPTTPQSVSEHGRQLLRSLYDSNKKAELALSTEVLAHTQALPDTQPPSADNGTVIVVRGIGSPETAEGRRVAATYGDLVGRALPLVPVPSDLAAVRAELVSEFPHAASIVDVLLADLAGRDYIKIRPTVVVGEPGCGKTTFAMRFFELVGVPRDLVSGPGQQDGTFSGTPRRWQSTAPCTPIALIKRSDFANPAIIVDEIEKSAQSRQHGQLHDVLLTMLEPATSQAWPDPCIEAPVDLSHVNWLGTANSLDGIPGPLRDRVRVLKFPSPRAEHIHALAASMLQRVASERRLHEGWVAPIDGEELEALRNAWPGGSLRKLQRLVDGVLSARDRWQMRMAN